MSADYIYLHPLPSSHETSSNQGQPMLGGPKVRGRISLGRPMTDNTVDGTNPANQLRLVVYPFIPVLFTRFFASQVVV